MKKLLIFLLVAPVVMNNASSQDVVYESGHSRDKYGRVEIERDMQATNATIENSNTESAQKAEVKEQTLSQVVITKSLPEGFYSGMQWLNAGKYASSFFSQWLDSWRSMNVEYYLSHYSKNFDNYESWAMQKRELAKAKTYIKVEVSSVKLLKHPEKEIMVATFLQDYESNNYSDETWKRQYWQKESDDRWRIVYESTIEGPSEPFLERYNN